MSTQKYIECSHCNRAVDVSEVADEHVNCGYFHDGAVIEIYCQSCGGDTSIEVGYHVSYKVIREGNPYQPDEGIDFDEEVF